MTYISKQVELLRMAVVKRRIFYGQGFFKVPKRGQRQGFFKVPCYRWRGPMRREKASWGLVQWMTSVQKARRECAWNVLQV